MTHAIFTHDFKEAIHTKITRRKIGVGSYFWGIIKFTKYAIKQKLIPTGLCEWCGENKHKSIHGYHKLMGMD